MDTQNQQPQPQPQPQSMQAPQMNQPVTPNTQPFQEAPKVQYVVAQKSLEGIGGWLAFFMVVFGLSAIGAIAQTFQTPAGVHTVTGPIMFIASLAATVLIAMRKKTALWAVYAALGVSFLVAVINLITSDDTPEAAALIGGVLVSLVLHGLLGLYFYVSKRVKATLVN